MDGGLNDVKHGVRPTHSSATGTQNGHGNVYIFHLCCALPLKSLATISLHKRICISCLSCRVEMGLCVCTQWAVMRSTAVQLTKWNPNKRSRFTLTAAESSWWLLEGQRKVGLSRAHAPLEPLTFRDARPHAVPWNTVLPRTTPAEQIPKNPCSRNRKQR